MYKNYKNINKINQHLNKFYYKYFKHIINLHKNIKHLDKFINNYIIITNTIMKNINIINYTKNKKKQFKNIKIMNKYLKHFIKISIRTFISHVNIKHIDFHNNIYNFKYNHINFLKYFYILASKKKNKKKKKHFKKRQTILNNIINFKKRKNKPTNVYNNNKLFKFNKINVLNFLYNRHILKYIFNKKKYYNIKTIPTIF